METVSPWLPDYTAQMRYGFGYWAASSAPGSRLSPASWLGTPVDEELGILAAKDENGSIGQFVLNGLYNGDFNQSRNSEYTMSFAFTTATDGEKKMRAIR